jgi:hypothetical protein
MISWFTPLFPNELFYSICARYKQQLGYRDIDVNRELFSKDIVRPMFLSPFEFSALKNNVPKAWLPSLEHIIRNHSTVPLAIPLSGQEFSMDVIGLQNGLGELEPALRRMERERYALGYAYCQECLKADSEKYGTTYWHREHNVQGVFVCTKHQIFLNYEKIALIGNSLSYQTAPRYEDITTQPFRLNLDNADHDLFFKLAEDISLLLHYDHVETYRAQVSSAIKSGVRKYRIDYKGNPSIKAVEALLNQTYSEELRILLDFPVPIKPGLTSWCNCLTSNVLNTSVLTTLLALYALGMRPRITSGDTNCGRLNFDNQSKFVLDGGYYDDQELPMSVVLRKNHPVPLGVPIEIKNKIYAQALGDNSRSQRLKRLKKLYTFPMYYDLEFSTRVKAALNILIKSEKRVTMQFLAAQMNISPSTFKTLIQLDKDLCVTVEQALESTLDFAKRKIRMKAVELSGQGVQLSPKRLVKETNTHIHYHKLKKFISECIADIS